MAQKWLDPKETTNIICIEYPAIVKDEEKAISCLGGIEVINKVIDDPNNRRLELRFRPSDVFSKPTCTEPKDMQGKTIFCTFCISYVHKERKDTLNWLLRSRHSLRTHNTTEDDL